MSEKRIVDFLTLERIEEDIFRGESRNLGSPQVYGGQVLGQSLAAAQATVEGRDAHSVHAYFLRRGDFEAPIIYQVDRSRDGGSFASRRVVAIQHGNPIFTMSASFQKEEQGLEFYKEQKPFPPHPEKDSSFNLDEYDASKLAPKNKALRLHNFGFYVAAATQKTDHITGEESGVTNRWWFRTVESVGDDKLMHRSILAYISDAGLITSTTKPHGYGLTEGKRISNDFMIASLDHAIWFHRPFRVDEWLLYECTAISTGNGRGLARGSIYQADGTLVANSIQEGVVRERR